jgi:pyruvate formate lyase activating enzyme
VSELHGLVFDIRKFSLHDGPGIRTTVFFKGCPLNCWWCHNPESQSPAPEVMLWESRCIHCGTCVSTCAVEAAGMTTDAQTGSTLPTIDRDVCTVCGSCVAACAADARQIVGARMTVSEVMSQIERDVAFFEESGGGVTFSGGEPLSQRPFLAELLKACKALEIHTTLDTSGYAPWKTVDSIRGDVDLFLYDLKLMDDIRHREYTGVPNGLILHNLRALSERGHNIILRVPVIPGITDDTKNLNEIGEFAATLPRLERVDILPYHPSAQGKYERLGKPYRLAGTQTPTDERMDGIAHLLGQYNLVVKIGG